MSIKDLFTLALMLVALPASAQPAPKHPCDTVPPTVYRFKASVVPSLVVGFCFNGEDTEGNPLPIGTVGFKLDIEGVGAIDLGPLQPVIGPNADGYSYYEARVQLSPGWMHIHAYSTTGESAGSTAMNLTLQGRPKEPTKTIIKGEN